MSRLLSRYSHSASDLNLKMTLSLFGFYLKITYVELSVVYTLVQVAVCCLLFIGSTQNFLGAWPLIFLIDYNGP